MSVASLYRYIALIGSGSVLLMILVTWPLFCHSCSLFPWTCPLLSTMSLNLATLWSFCPLCPESHSCSLWTVTWPLLFTMPCNLATLVHYAVLLGLSCSLCPGTWPLLSTMSWNLAALVHYVLEIGHSWPLLSTISWNLATLGPFDLGLDHSWLSPFLRTHHTHSEVHKWIFQEPLAAWSVLDTLPGPSPGPNPGPPSGPLLGLGRGEKKEAMVKYRSRQWVNGLGGGGGGEEEGKWQTS